MKRPAPALLTILSLLFTAGLANAQQPGQVDAEELMRHFQDPEAMQRMALEAEAAQKCMEGIEQDELAALEKRATQLSREVEELCKAGKKDEALEQGLAFAKQMNSDPTVAKLRDCSTKMTAMLGELPWAQVPGVKDQPDPTRDDICR